MNIWGIHGISEDLELDLPASVTPRLILPSLDPGYRFVWPGETIIPGSEFYDFRVGAWFPCTKLSIGTIMPLQNVHNSLAYVAVRIPRY